MPTQAFNGSFTVATKDISIYCDSVTFERSNDVLDTTTFGSVAHTFVTGLTNGTITVAGLWDKTASTGSYTVLAPLVGTLTSSAFVWGPEGTTAGKVKYTGSCVLDTYTESDPVADLIKFTAKFQITGAVTAGVYP